MIRLFKKLRPHKRKPRENYRETVVGGRVAVAPRNIPGVFEIPARSHIAEGIILSGQYEVPVIQALEQLTLPTGVLVNVGANVGLISVWLARKWQRKVIAIEPNPEAFQLLASNVSANQLADEIQTVQACVGETKGSVEFYTIEGKPEYSSIGGINHPAVAGLPQRAIQVPVLPLSEIVSAQKVALLFVDVEGAEGLVFRGGLEVLRRDKPILVFECSSRLLQKFGWTSVQIESELAAVGYRIHPVEARRKLQHPMEGEFIALAGS